MMMLRSISKRWTVTLSIGLLGIATFACATYLWLVSDLPAIHTLADYHPIEHTEIYSNDGYLLARLGIEKRRVVPLKKIPLVVQHAFIAAEDAGFYNHHGLDFLSIVRAAFKNLRPNARRQGASTITQQTVKTMVLGAERSYTRKIREAILALRLEANLTKEDILFLYLNQIYFGSGAYGVGQAAQTYFGKTVDTLSVGQAAYLAAIPKNPSRYTLIKNPKAAKQRQIYVLKHMLANHWITQEQAQYAIEQPPPMLPKTSPYLGKAPYFIDTVRQKLINQFGIKRTLQGGLTVYTGLSASLQSAAQHALDDGLESIAKRHGYSGALGRIEVNHFKQRLQQLHRSYLQKRDIWRRHHPHAPNHQPLVWDLNIQGTHLQLRPLQSGLKTNAVVTKLDPHQQLAWVDLGNKKVPLTLQQLRWAHSATQKKRPRNITEILHQGDIIHVGITLENTSETSDPLPIIKINLIAPPKMQGALVAIDPHTRFVRSLVGGYHHVSGGFNRAMLALRQPGSAFKAVVYAAALQNDIITGASLCQDTPLVIRDPWNGHTWRPHNYHKNDYEGPITYHRALAKSKNTCAVRLAQKLTPKTIAEMATQLGIHTSQPNNLTIALGSGNVTPLHLVNAYTTIAAGGWFAEPIFIRKVVDAQDRIIYTHDTKTQSVLKPEVAYVLTDMLKAVIQSGTGQKAKILGRPLAGKTGTTNNSRDAWFAGYSPNVVAGVWVGYDHNEPMPHETGSSAALPIWIQYMRKALHGHPVVKFNIPSNIVFRRISPKTGQLSHANNALSMPFIRGSEPNPKTQTLPSIFIEDELALTKHE